MKKRTLTFVVAALALSGACSNKEPESTGTTPPPSTSAQVVQATDALKFGPAILEIKAGETVEWQNNGTLPHTVTFTDGPAFDQQLAAKSKVTRTFSAAGTFDYKCSIHPPNMTGKIVVT